MAYVSNEQYNHIRNIRCYIDGCLNRIAVTDDADEITKQIGHLENYLKNYAKHNRDRIAGEYHPDPIVSVKLDLL